MSPRLSAILFTLAGLILDMGKAGAATPAATPLRLSGQGPYYQLNLPLGWQALSQDDDLGDVRILNQQGESLPYAWVDVPDSAALEKRQRLPLFRWSDRKTAVPSNQSAKPLPRSPSSSSWPIWVIDLKSSAGTVRRLQLHWPDQGLGVYALAVDASSDMQQWREVKGMSQLTSLAHQGGVLRQDEIELDGVKARYLRLRLLPGSAEPALQDVDVITAENVALTPAWSWSEPIKAAHCTPQSCDYPVPERVSLHRLKVMLTEPNTLLKVQVRAMPWPPNGARPNRHGHHLHWRDRLHTLRHKGREQASADAAESDWPVLTEGSVHWIQREDAQQRSEEVALPPGRQRMLRLVATSGATDWMRRPPAIEVAGWSRSLVFLARGGEPYRLAWADIPPHAPVQSVALPMSQLMPGASGQALVPTGQALITASPPAQQRLAALAPSSSVAASRPSSVSDGPAQPAAIPRAWWLWSALLLGLGVMAWMAKSLLAPAKPADPAER